MADKLTNHRRIKVNADVHLGRCLVPQHRAATQVRLDVNPMRRNQVYQPLVAAKFSTGKAHAGTIVSNDDDVKRQSTPFSTLLFLVCLNRPEKPAVFLALTGPYIVLGWLSYNR